MTGPIPRPKLPYFYTYSKLNCLKNILLAPTHLFIPYMKVNLGGVGGGGRRGRGCHLRRIDDVIMKCRIQERSPRGPGPPYFPGRNKGRIFFFFKHRALLLSQGVDEPSPAPAPLIGRSGPATVMVQRLCIACLIDFNKWPIVVNSPFRVLYFPCFCRK